jgi:hypothetical protein
MHFDQPIVIKLLYAFKILTAEMYQLLHFSGGGGSNIYNNYNFGQVLATSYLKFYCPQ